MHFVASIPAEPPQPSGTTTMSLDELKSLTDGLKADWDLFKKTHTEQLKAMASGKSVADLEAKLVTINTAIDAKSDQLNKLETAFKRTGNGGEQQDEKSKLAQEHKAAFMSFVRKGDEAGLLKLAETKALQVSDDTAGGFMVHADLSGRIVKRVFETSPIRQFAAVQTISTDALEGPVDSNEADAGWVAETGVRTTTATPKIGMWRIPTHELYAQPPATQKLLDDAAWDAETWLSTKIADKMARIENASFVNGDGVTKPRGFLTWTTVLDDSSLNYFEQKKIGYVITGTADNFAPVPTAGTDQAQGDSIINLVYSLKSQYRDMPGTAFAMHRTTYGRVRRLRDNLGNYLWQPGFAGQPATVFSYPIGEFNDMPQLGATSKFAVAFANWREAYQIVDRQGIRVLRDPFTAKPFVLFYSVKRTGGDVINPEAIKLLKLATS
jgi:HK97 family phage major capsid protein